MPPERLSQGMYFEVLPTVYPEAVTLDLNHALNAKFSAADAQVWNAVLLRTFQADPGLRWIVVDIRDFRTDLRIPFMEILKYPNSHEFKELATLLKTRHGGYLIIRDRGEKADSIVNRAIDKVSEFLDLILPISIANFGEAEFNDENLRVVMDAAAKHYQEA